VPGARAASSVLQADHGGGRVSTELNHLFFGQGADGVVTIGRFCGNEMGWTGTMIVASAGRCRRIGGAGKNGFSPTCLLGQWWLY